MNNPLSLVIPKRSLLIALGLLCCLPHSTYSVNKNGDSQDPLVYIGKSVWAFGKKNRPTSLVIATIVLLYLKESETDPLWNPEKKALVNMKELLTHHLRGLINKDYRKSNTSAVNHLYRIASEFIIGFRGQDATLELSHHENGDPAVSIKDPEPAYGMCGRSWSLITDLVQPLHDIAKIKKTIKTLTN